MNTRMRQAQSGAGFRGDQPYEPAPRPELPAIAWHLCPELPLAELDGAAPALTRLQVQLLANRGLGAATARAFLQADWRGSPPAPLGLDAAVARLRLAGTRGERVVVFGDYDADGLTSCAVMLLALRRAGIAAEPYLPGRADDGRGLNTAAVRTLAGAGTTLIVTTDCGTTNVEEVRLAASLSMEVIVTDHHPPQGALAPALAIVNPRQPGCPSGATDLAGVGVAFRVAEALLAGATGATDAAALAELLDLVAVGTIGDVAPLTPENWALAHAGLERLNAAPRPGLRALAAQAGLRVGEITERDISFALAPRLNAAGRMGDPMLALRLLLTDNPAEATTLAAELQRLNQERQRATDAVMAEARAQALAQLAAEAPAVVVVSGAGWPLGVIGLVAARLTEDLGRPCLAVSVNGAECRGSARGPAGLNLVETLAGRADLLRYFGGHAQAAGFTLATADLPALVAHLRAAAQIQVAQSTPQAMAAGDGHVAAPPAVSPQSAAPSDAMGPAADVAAPADAAVALPDTVVDALPPALALPAVGVGELCVDCRLPLRRVGADTYAAVRALAPYGPAFEPPIFLAQRLRVVRGWRSGPEGRTLRLILRDGTEERLAFWPRQGPLLPVLRDLGPVDVVYLLDTLPRPDGLPEVVLRVLGMRPA